MADAPVIVCFRRDLRIADNRALAAAVAARVPVLAVFILDDDSPGQWRSGAAARWWLHQSLTALSADLSARGLDLLIRRGRATSILPELARATGARMVNLSRSYEPWARAGEDELHAALSAEGVALKRYGGSLLFEPDAVRTKSGDPYKVYTPFWRTVSSGEPPRMPTAAPKKLVSVDRLPHGLSIAELDLLPTKPDWSQGFGPRWSPGEQGAGRRLEHFLATAVERYDTDRNRPDLPGTSGLSPHLANGEISPAACWHAALAAGGGQARPGTGLETFLKELVWREFSYHLLFNWPTLPEQPFRADFQRFPWAAAPDHLEAWQRGLTGYPIVDAGMRELWTTGWMHNRVRMIVGSFLVKNLLIPWQAGEAWFWDTLVDADLASNAASWQWVAGSGADAAPYFRIFNPITQGDKFDPDGAYIRRWVPELARLPNKLLNAPWTAPAEVLSAAGVVLGRTYPRPIVDLAETRSRALAAYATLKTAA